MIFAISNKFNNYLQKVMLIIPPGQLLIFIGLDAGGISLLLVACY